MQFTKRLLAKVVNETLSPTWQIRNAAGNALHQAMLTTDLIAAFRWRDVILHRPPSHLIVAIPGVKALRLPQELVPAVSAWFTVAAEKDLRTDPDHFVFPTIVANRYVPSSPMNEQEIRSMTVWTADDVAEPTNQDLRDVAALILGHVRGARGVYPVTIAQTRWGDLDEFDLRYGHTECNPRISLFEALEDWGAIWESLVGRDWYPDDPILIPASAGRISWEPDESGRWTRPKPLTTKGYYGIFRKRGSMAGYPSLSATDCTVEGDGTKTTETAF